MTEKRFKAHIFDDGVNERYHDGIIDNEKNGNIIRNYQYISMLLNELYDENKELKDEVHDWKASAEDYLKLGKSLQKENKELKDLLKSMADRNNEIWLDNGQIIRLEKVFKGG